MADEYIEISTKQGKLKGRVQKSEGPFKTTYYSFQGIPYAKPPIDKLRFKVSQEYGKWEGIWDATKVGNDSLQKHMLFKNLHVGNEDCLYLNVYTTQPGKESAKKAVMVWIHGGGFARGSGSSELYGPDFLIEEDIVMVSINYRCGVFGFLSLENDKLPGNLGLKDQTLALHWVQQNIESFGGDPKNVTIFGESAGGASVNYHLLSPLSRGLFHKAIAQSGFSICQWALQNKPKDKALLLAKRLGCASEDPDEILNFLMSVPAEDIVKAQDDPTLPSDKEKIQTFSLIFLPCVEIAGDAPFLPESPRKMMEKGDFAKVPIIMGLVDKEGLLALALEEVNCENVNSDIGVMVPIDLDVKGGSKEEQNLGKEILKFYTGKDTLSWDVVHGYVDFVSDIGFTFGYENSRQYFLKNNTSVYTYQFSYTSPRCFSSFLIPMAYPDKAADFVGCGASHGDELALLFKTNMSQVPFIPPTAEDKLFMNKFLKAWTTFAKTGNPNCKELEVDWKADSLQSPHFLDIGKVWTMVNDTLFPKRMEFWKKIYEKYSYSY